MTTIRSHDQFNTTIYGLEDRYRGIHNERRVVFMNADDIPILGPPAGRLACGGHPHECRWLKLPAVRFAVGDR